MEECDLQNRLVCEGKSLKSEEICLGNGEPCQSVANAKVHSTLEHSRYRIGQWVSL